MGNITSFYLIPVAFMSDDCKEPQRPKSGQKKAKKAEIVF